MATALNDNLRRRTWPGDGPVDDRLLAIAGNLVRAHDLIERRLRTYRAAQLGVQAGRGRCAHPGPAHPLRDRPRASRSPPVPRPEPASQATGRRRQVGRHKLAALRLAAARIDPFEQVAGAEVYRSFPAALDGQQRASHGTRSPS